MKKDTVRGDFVKKTPFAPKPPRGAPPPPSATIIPCLSLSLKEPYAPPPLFSKYENWMLTTDLRSDTTLAVGMEDAFLRLYRHAASPNRHLILLAPAPAPALGKPWGLSRLLVADHFFHAWLTAALRLSALCRVSLLLPHAALPSDLSAARAAIERAMAALYRNGENFDDMIDLGVTLGTPASLLSSKQFCEEADFTVIDTDALLSLSFAATSDAPLFEKMLKEHAIGILRLLETSVGNAHNAGRFSAIGGRLAFDPTFCGELLALGADAVILPDSSAIFHHSAKNQKKRISFRA